MLKLQENRLQLKKIDKILCNLWQRFTKWKCQVLEKYLLSVFCYRTYVVWFRQYPPYLNDFTFLHHLFSHLCIAYDNSFPWTINVNFHFKTNIYAAYLFAAIFYFFYFFFLPVFRMWCNCVVRLERYKRFSYYEDEKKSLSIY